MAAVRQTPILFQEAPVPEAHRTGVAQNSVVLKEGERVNLAVHQLLDQGVCGVLDLLLDLLLEQLLADLLDHFRVLLLQGCQILPACPDLVGQFHIVTLAANDQKQRQHQQRHHNGADEQQQRQIHFLIGHRHSPVSFPVTVIIL